MIYARQKIERERHVQALQRRPDRHEVRRILDAMRFGVVSFDTTATHPSRPRWPQQLAEKLDNAMVLK